MPKLSDLQEQRAHAVAEMRSLSDKADTEGRDLSDSEHNGFKTLKDRVANLDKSIEIARDLAEAERAAPAILHHGRGDGAFETRARDFSVTKAIASCMGEQIDVGFEREISAETSRRAGRACRGQFMVPDQVFLTEKRAFGDQVMLTSGVAADLVPNVHRPDLFIDKLRSSIVVGRLGATVLDGLVGTIDIPKQTGSASVEWLAEDGGITDSALAFSDVNLAPKTVAAIASYSRRTLINAVPSIENIVRSDLAAIVANEIDRVAMVGDGNSNRPSGVTKSGNSTELSLANPSWEAVLNFPATIQSADADVGSMAWVMHPASVMEFRSRPKDALLSHGYLMDTPTAMAGYPVVTTTTLPAAADGSPDNPSTVIFGAWSQLLVGYWSGLDLLVNPYETTAYQKGRVLVRVMRDVDVAVRHPESFVYADDLVAEVGSPS